ncbi:MAG: EVE domain-containing protein [Bdellovibrionales bacterium]
MRYWLMKSEPDVFSIDDLAKKGTSLWDGVRNYQARNFMMKEMKVGDTVLFYHSNAEPPGVAGLAKVASPAVPDPTQFDKKSEYFEPRATKEKPVWHCVKVEFVEKFPRLVSLAEIRTERQLAKMLLLRPGQRLSIQPVEEREFKCLRSLAHR